MANIFKKSINLIKQSKPTNISNPGSEALNQAFKSVTQLKPTSEKQGLSKFSGLKRYLKRTF